MGLSRGLDPGLYVLWVDAMYRRLLAGHVLQACMVQECIGAKSGSVSLKWVLAEEFDWRSHLRETHIKYCGFLLLLLK